MINKHLLIYIYPLLSLLLRASSPVQNEFQWSISNHSYNKADIGAAIYIDDKLLISTPSINQSYMGDRSYQSYLDTGIHYIRVESLGAKIQAFDTVRVLSPPELHRLWITYKHMPDPQTQFAYMLQNKFQKKMENLPPEAQDSLKVYTQLRLQLIEDQKYWLRDTISPSFKITWFERLDI